MDTHISLEDTHNITQNHLCSVFANLLDNAIMAEIGFDDEHKDKKIITVKAVNDRTNVYITVKIIYPELKYREMIIHLCTDTVNRFCMILREYIRAILQQ